MFFKPANFSPYPKSVYLGKKGLEVTWEEHEVRRKHTKSPTELIDFFRRPGGILSFLFPLFGRFQIERSITLKNHAINHSRH